MLLLMDLLFRTLKWRSEDGEAAQNSRSPGPRFSFPKMEMTTLQYFLSLHSKKRCIRKSGGKHAHRHILMSTTLSCPRSLWRILILGFLPSSSSRLLQTVSAFPSGSRLTALLTFVLYNRPPEPNSRIMGASGIFCIYGLGNRAASC